MIPHKTRIDQRIDTLDREIKIIEIQCDKFDKHQELVYMEEQKNLRHKEEFNYKLKSDEKKFEIMGKAEEHIIKRGMQNNKN